MSGFLKAFPSSWSQILTYSLVFVRHWKIGPFNDRTAVQYSDLDCLYKYFTFLQITKLQITGPIQLIYLQQELRDTVMLKIMFLNSNFDKQPSLAQKVLNFENIEYCKKKKVSASLNVLK